MVSSVSVAFFLGIRQPLLPTVIVGAHYCNSGNRGHCCNIVKRGHCWNTLFQQWHSVATLTDLGSHYPTVILDTIVALVALACPADVDTHDLAWITLEISVYSKEYTFPILLLPFSVPSWWNTDTFYLVDSLFYPQSHYEVLTQPGFVVVFVILSVVCLLHFTVWSWWDTNRLYFDFDITLTDKSLCNLSLL
jgi:hypothetical protein